MRIFLSRSSSTVGLWLSCRFEEGVEKDVRTLLCPYRVLLRDLFYYNCCYGKKRVRTFPVLCFYLPFTELLPGKCPLVITPWISSHLAARAAHCSLGSCCGWRPQYPAELDHPWQKWDVRQESLQVHWCPRERQRPQRNFKTTCAGCALSSLLLLLSVLLLCLERVRPRHGVGPALNYVQKVKKNFLYHSDILQTCPYLQKRQAGWLVLIELFTVSIDSCGLCHSRFNF